MQKETCGTNQVEVEANETNHYDSMTGAEVVADVIETTLRMIESTAGRPDIRDYGKLWLNRWERILEAVDPDNDDPAENVIRVSFRGEASVKQKKAA